VEPGPLATAASNNSNANLATPAAIDAQSELAALPQPQRTTQSQRTEVVMEDAPGYVPAPKSLINTQSATEVAAINTGITGPTNAMLTSLVKPIDVSVGKTPSRVAQLKLAPSAEPWRVGEKRRVAVELNSDVPLGLAVLTLRFDPRVIKVQAVSAGTMLASGKDLAPGVSSSVDLSGVCLISISALNGAQPMSGSGVLLFLDIEGVGAGDSGLAFDKFKTNLMATDAREVMLDLLPGQIAIKQ
ncbi:MAG TPA: cohesin domain-containing protein, partial [Pyrinomonadaceae bacterium]|nr:cohesin domain-containing protein [Pyrinomonadaceae bacterium]